MSNPSEINSSEAENLNRLFADHYQRVYRTILGLIHEPMEAEDLTQETFIKAYRGLPDFRGQASLATWLTRIARNVVLDDYRRRDRKLDACTSSLDDSEFDILPIEQDPTPAQATEKNLSDQCIRSCIASLPGVYRRVMELHDLHGVPTAEIAQMLGLSTASVKIRIHRGRQHLRARVGRHCDLYVDECDDLICQRSERSARSEACVGRRSNRNESSTTR